MSRFADAEARPQGAELARRISEVAACARRIAGGDTGLTARGDMDADDVAQDIAIQYQRRSTEPLSLRGWTATATRHRLIDLSRQRAPIPVEDDELSRGLERSMGPSEQIFARVRYRAVLKVLAPTEQAVINDHLSGATNQDIARSHGYKSETVASHTISRIKQKLRKAFPDMRYDLAPQRIY